MNFKDKIRLNNDCHVSSEMGVRIIRLSDDTIICINVCSFTDNTTLENGIFIG